MNFNKIICSSAIISTCMITSANSSTDNINCLLSNSSQYITSHLLTSVSAGPIWGKAGNTQTLELEPTVLKIYSSDRSTQTIGYGEFFIGFYNNYPRNLQTQFGLAVATTTETDLSGEVWEDASPLFNNHKYNYRLQHSHLALKGKLLLDKKYTLTPWISGSMGVGFNRARFNNQPLIDGGITMPDFEKNTTTAFTYSLGAGVQYQLDQKMQIGIGYEFADWGKSKLKPSDSQTTSARLSLSHFYTHGVLANFTYFI